MRSIFSISGFHTPPLLKARIFLPLALLIWLAGQARAQSCVGPFTIGSAVGIPNLTALGCYSLSGAEITVKGIFKIDNGQTWVLDDNTYLYMDPNARIDVELGGTLQMTDVHVQRSVPNGGKWSSILAASASIIADRCFVSGGQVALQTSAASLTSVFSVTNSKFTGDNGIAIRMTGSQAPAQHNISENDFTEGAGTAISVVNASNVAVGSNTYLRDGPAMTGVDINNSSNVTVTGGLMTSLTLGVSVSNNSSSVAVRNIEMVDLATGAALANSSGITLTQVTQKNLGMGVSVTNSRLITMESVFFYGQRGVSANKCRDRFNMIKCSIRAIQQAIEITDHTTNNALNPLPPNSQNPGNGDIFINGTTATSQLNTALRIANTLGDGKIDLLKNFVIPSFDTPTFSYYGIEVTDVANSKLRIRENFVIHTPFQNQANGPVVPAGIYVLRSKRQTVVRNNRVNTNQFGDYRFGIGIYQSPNLEVVGNTVDGGPNAADRAIAIEEAGQNVLLCCNTLDRSVRGLNMVGGQENCRVFNTKYGTLGTALYYDHVLSSNSPQFHRGNDWSTAATTWDGYYDGNNLLAQAVFYTVDPSLLPSGLNKIFVSGGSASDWFSDLTGAEAICVNTDASFCGETPRAEPPEGPEQLSGNDLWAAQPLQDAGYASVHWYAQRRLYDKLARNPALQSATAAVGNFYAAAQSGNLGKLRAVEQGITGLAEPPASISAAYQALQNTAGGLYVGLAELDEQMALASAGELPALLSQRAALWAQADAVQQQIDAYEPAIAAARAQRLGELQVLNASVAPLTGFEANEKDVNSVWLAALAQGSWALGEAQKAVIDGIAALCPSVGGPAVYQARLLQEHYRMPDWNLDDCSATYQRNGLAQATSIACSVYPNPASDVLRVEFGAAPADCQVELIALTGQVMAVETVPAGASGCAMLVSQVPNGCYFLRVRSAGGALQQQKVAIAR